jgi:glutathione S-transferase
MIVVHHLERSRSQRVLWLLEELGVPYEVRRYARDPRTLLAPPELLAVHPLGKSPVITDGALVLAESAAILEYVVAAHGHGRLRPPAGSADWVRYLYWLHAAEGSLMPPLVMKLVFDRVETQSPWVVRPVARAIAGRVKQLLVTPNVTRQLAYVERELAARPWFAGDDFSAADIQMSYPLQGARARAGIPGSRPHIDAWLARIEARPAYLRAIARGGPVELAA